MSDTPNLTPESATRLATIEARLTRLIDKEYGYSIPDLILPAIFEDARNDVTVSIEVYGGDTIPDDKALLQSLIKNNELAQRALGQSDDTEPKTDTKKSWSDMQKLRPEERMRLAREGK